MHERTYSLDEIARAVDVVSAVVEERISAAPSAAFAAAFLTTRLVLQSVRPLTEQPLRTIQIDE